jgi:microsomal dipeptidase-like Zn-dependent dipeptidase
VPPFFRLSRFESCLLHLAFPAAVLLLSAAAAHAQTHPNLDFEDGLSRWTSSGDAFAGQPLDPSVSPAAFPASPLGGDYWQSVAYPLGHHGRYLVSTTDAQRGTLTSDEFALGPDDRYFSILIGSSATTSGQRVELHVDAPDGTSAVAWRTGGPGIALLQLRVFPIPAELFGRRARIVIVDDSPDAHITVDYARLTADPPRPEAGRIWGIADYHAHPMSYLGFGAATGVHALWGRPGTAAAAYDGNPELFELDLPNCSNDHGGGHTAGIFINTAEKRLLPQDLRPRGFKATVRALFRLVTGYFTRHGDAGAPGFDDYPSFLSGAHQQMHVTQLHRAWQGGLRLMVALAVHNRGVEFLVSPPRDAAPTSDRDALEAQVCGMRRLAALNADWMQIAYSPEEARDTILSGRMAVVLGAELDELGELGFPSIDEEVQYLWDLGIRQVTPVHGMDNRLGGAAVFEPAYNSMNDLLHRGPLNLGPADLARWAPVFFDVRNGGCTSGPLAGRRGDCVLFKLSPTQERAAVARTVFSPFVRTAMLQQVQVPAYRAHSGHMNARGLSPDGRTYLVSLLSRGMLIGLEHMSQRTADEASALLAERQAPIFVSHAHFRGLAVQDRRRTTAEGFLPNEFDVSDRLVETVRTSGGAIGTFLYANPIETHPDVSAPFANDCAASSKGFAYNLLYVLHRMGGSGVGLASDFTFVPMAGPRFGRNACWGLKDHWDARPDVGPLREQYRPDRQQDGVRYEGLVSPPSVRLGANAPLKPYTMGRRTFDFNVDGLAHYGLLPDLLQDLKNIGVGTREFEALFSSAEAYVATWERSARLSSDLYLRPFTPRQLPCEAICRGLCP